MKRSTQKRVGIIASLMLLAGFAQADEIKVGMPAPDFELMDQQGNVQALSSYRGKWVVLYFYPKDDTPGCTKEACHFRDDIFLLKKANAQILGVSIDTRESHKKFAEKYSLPFPLLADVKGKVATGI
jgi:peroxiredoxin Q/BCP